MLEVLKEKGFMEEKYTSCFTVGLISSVAGVRESDVVPKLVFELDVK